jgi:hypothetical protein
VIAAEDAKQLKISDGLNSLPAEVQRRIEELDGLGDDTAVEHPITTFRSQNGRRQKPINDPSHGQQKKRRAKMRVTETAKGQFDREKSDQPTTDEPIDSDIASAEDKRKHKKRKTCESKGSAHQQNRRRIVTISGISGTLSRYMRSGRRPLASP